MEYENKLDWASLFSKDSFFQEEKYSFFTQQNLGFHFELISQVGSFYGHSNNSYKEAEKKAFTKYDNFIKCKHLKAKRISNDGLGICSSCGHKGRFLENLLTCSVDNCDKSFIKKMIVKSKGNHLYLEENCLNFCPKHYLQHLNEELQKEDLIFFKNEIVFINSLISSGIIKGSESNEELNDIYLKKSLIEKKIQDIIVKDKDEDEHEDSMFNLLHKLTHINTIEDMLMQDDIFVKAVLLGYSDNELFSIYEIVKENEEF